MKAAMVLVMVGCLASCVERTDTAPPPSGQGECQALGGTWRCDYDSQGEPQRCYCLIEETPPA